MGLIKGEKAAELLPIVYIVGSVLTILSSLVGSLLTGGALSFIVVFIGGIFGFAIALLIMFLLMQHDSGGILGTLGTLAFLFVGLTSLIGVITGLIGLLLNMVSLSLLGVFSDFLALSINAVLVYLVWKARNQYM